MNAINTFVIIGTAIVAGLGLLYTYNRLRRIEVVRQLHPIERSEIAMTALFAIAILMHLDFHGHLFRCDMSNCPTRATLWITGFAVAFVSQPITAMFLRHPYRRRDWMAWLVLGCGLFVLAFASGRALHTYLYLFGREWIVR